MRKNALAICCFTCAAGAIGTFCRWLQNQLSFDEAGLSVSSAWNFIVPLILIAAAACFYIVISKYKSSGLAMTADIYATLGGGSKLFIPSAWLIGAVMIFGALILLATGDDDSNAVLYRVLAVFACFSGISFPLAAVGARKRFGPGLTCLFTTAPIIQFCIWLITSYKRNSTNPTVWAYAVEILAIAACLIAFYYFAGYAYGRVKPYSTLYFSMLGSFLSIVALADDRNFGLQLMLVSAIGMQLSWAWMIVSRRYTPLPPAGEEPEPPQGVAKPADEHNLDSILDEFRGG